MLEELFKLVTTESQEHIIDNPQIPNEHNEVAVQTTTDSIFETLKGQVSQGNGADVLSLLGGRSSMQGNPIVNGLVGNVTNSLMDKLGIDSPIAKQIAAALVPVIIGKLVNRTNDPKDNGFDLNSIFGSLTNGRSNQFDMENLLGQVSGNQQQQPQSQEMDLGNIFNILSGR